MSWFNLPINWRTLLSPRGLVSFALQICQHVFSRRGLLVVVSILVCSYALAVLYHVQSISDLGIKSAFGPFVKGLPHDIRLLEPGNLEPRQGDRIVRVGDDLPILTWPDLLTAPAQLAKELADCSRSSPPSWAKPIEDNGDETWLVRVAFQRPRENAEPLPFEAWCTLGRLPLEDMVPAILWFFLKLTLFVVGVLVFWKRPTDRSAAMFFFLCVVTMGAYIGGYHWPHISTVPVLLLGFMVCGVLLPAVSLHFYLVFPRPKRLLDRYPVRTLLAVYGLPLLMLVALIVRYLILRWVNLHHAQPTVVEDALDALKHTIYVSLGVSALWYLACVVSLVHSYRTVTDATERNQVKWILFGAMLALLPIGYSFYLAVWWPDEFGAGEATWPMFAASVCLTAAFIISITRYRLMELDQLVSSGALYFLIMFLAGLVYYGVVFVGALLFNHVLAGPHFSETLTVSTTALLLMLILDFARSRVRKALDRRFYREKYHLDRTLRRMGEAVQQLVDPPTLLQRLLQASADLLGVSAGAVYLHEEDGSAYRLTGYLGPTSPPAELPAGCPLLEALGGGPVMARPRAGSGLTPAQHRLKALGGEVAHPLTHEGRLLAVLILGPKEGSPYRHEDLNLLAAFAQITALALENAAGHNTIEQLNHDLQAKLEKIAEQQRRILALQSQLRKQGTPQLQIADCRLQVEGKPSDNLQSAICNLQLGGIIGSSPRVRQLLQMVRKVADTPSVVLIRGESGTGKELLAQAVHDASPRAGKAFVKVHCAALAPTLLESELFGHVKGAFTGAFSHKTGRFELANGGTLFLDEIGDVSLDVQTKLLRVLQEKTFERVGSSEPLKVDVRIVAATHQDLEGLTRQGRFREDLYYRLNVLPLQVPPLRERAEDVAELVLHFLQQSAQRCRKDVQQIDDDALSALKAYSWPGNIRELENVIERAVVIAEGPAVTIRELPAELLQAVGAAALPGGWEEEPAAGGEFVVEVRLARAERDRRERELLGRALEAARGNKAEAARALGVARSTLISRMKKHGLA